MYLCIDLKSFYASVECVERGLDPMTAMLAVADPSRGPGGICLAITPAMKALGIKNRCRIFEIPKNVTYITAVPRMRLYMEYSARIYRTYLRYISPEDIYVYSVDECFIDISQYTRLYHKTDREMTDFLLEAVRRETGLYAAAGIGTNLFLAKVALDVTAKHAADFVGFLDEETFKATIWHHRPITDIWNIGPGIARRLERIGIHDLYDVAHYEEKWLYKEFGVNAEFLIDHAHGIEPCTIADIHACTAKTKSISNTQILFEEYTAENALLVMKEMVDNLVLELVGRRLAASSVWLSVGYARDVIQPTGGSFRLREPTNSYRKIVAAFEAHFRKTVRANYPVKRLGIALCGLVDERNTGATIDMFADTAAEEKERRLQEAVIGLRSRFGKNAVLKAMSYEEKATARMRNRLIGGHNAETLDGGTGDAVRRV